MIVFAGRFEYGIDDKNRVSIPSRFRDVLAADNDMRLILTNLDGCIVAYPPREWLSIQERTSSPGSIKKEHRAFLRYYYSGITECPIDKLGRILVPQSLRNDAEIKKNVVIIGVGTKIEIWAQERWVELVKLAKSDPDQVADIVSELGL